MKLLLLEKEGGFLYPFFVFLAGAVKRKRVCGFKTRTVAKGLD